MLANIGNYVPSSVEGLQEKLDACDRQFWTMQTSQAEIDEATKSLREARLNARTKADVSALEELIAYVNSLDLRAYTAESADSVLVLADSRAGQDLTTIRRSHRKKSTPWQKNCRSRSMLCSR